MNNKGKIVQEIKDYCKANNQPFNVNLTKMIIDETIKQVNEVNLEFLGRRIGEIDLELVYKENFNIQKPRKSNKP